MLRSAAGRRMAAPGHSASLRRIAGAPILRQATQQKQQQNQQRPVAAASRGQLRVSARYGSYRSSAPNVAERVLAAVPYLLPFLDAFSYGRFLFYQFPVIARAVAPIAPLLSLYHSVPFAALICFFGLYLGIVNNMQLPRFVRFSAMQAVLLDILLVLPRLLEQLVSPPTTAGLALKAYIIIQNSIWVAVAACVAYGAVCALLGKEARIPFVAEAAEAQVR